MPQAAKKVAKLPTRKSRGRAAPEVMLKSRHPRVSPQMAEGVKNASTHRASDARNWIAKEALLGNSRFCPWASTT